MSEDLQQLEEKIAYLERHVLEQDKAMLALAERVDRLQGAMLKLRGQLESVADASSSENLPSADERPPHY